MGRPPNPLNPATTLTFTTFRPGYVKIELFDISGRLVRDLLRSRHLRRFTRMIAILK